MSVNNKMMQIRISQELNKQIHNAHLKFLQINNMEHSDKIVSKTEFIRTILDKCTQPDFIIKMEDE